MDVLGVCSLIERGIVDFSRLVEIDESEQSFQDLFEKNPFLLGALGYSEIIPHPVINGVGGNKYIPDFIVKRGDGFWQLFELKRPNSKVLKDRARRNDWYSEMGSYLSQCIDYVDQLRNSSVLLDFESRYDVKMHPGFPVTIVAGMSDCVDHSEAARLLDRYKENIALATFDQVLSSMQAWYSASYPQAGDWSGLTIATNYKLDFFVCKGGCVFDMGWNAEKNRISLHRKSEDVVSISVFDKYGLKVEADFVSPDRIINSYVCLMINVFPVGESLRIVVEANGLHFFDMRVANMDFEIDANAPVLLGNDFERSGSACFMGGIFLARSPALSMGERAGLRDYMAERQAAQGGLRFLSGQFMYTEGHPLFDAARTSTGNMVQRSDGHRPTYCSGL